jgi:hypothetical protein
MSGLKATQYRFQAFVLGSDAAIDGQIAGSAALRRTRLDIYFDAYRLRLLEVLSNDFEALRAHLGRVEFERAARAYIEAQASNFRNVRWYGGGLSDFLAGHAHFGGRPEIAELARLEWALGIAFDAADAPVLRFEDLAGSAPAEWPSLVLEPHPSLQVLPLRTNAPALWHATREGGQPPPVRIGTQAVQYAIWRKDLASWFRSLAPEEALAIEALRAGRSFGEICGQLGERKSGEEAAALAAGFLRGWVDQGWLRAPDAHR